MEILFTLDNAKQFELIDSQIDLLKQKIKLLDNMNQETNAFLLGCKSSVELPETIKIKVLNYTIFELTQRIKTLKKKQKSLIYKL